MNKAKHTPGPWKFREAEGQSIEIAGIGYRGDVAFVDAPDWKGLATVATTGGSRTPESTANVRLIAAAPDLLKASKDLLEYMPTLTAFQRARCRQAEAAIAKAEGRG
jgi:hypothetical protein